MPRQYQALKRLVKPEELELDRTIHTWLVSVIERAYPDGIIPEGMNPEEASLLEETLAKYFEGARQQGRREGRREALRDARREALRERREGQLDGMRKALLQVMTSRFGRLPKDLRSRVEQINSQKELEALTRKVLSAKTLQEMGLG